MRGAASLANVRGDIGDGGEPSPGPGEADILGKQTAMVALSMLQNGSNA